jgi:predicted dinucleotide-binding enzyme
VRIGVIGTGNIGGTLGTALARAGHQVTLGSRHPQDAGAADGGGGTDATDVKADATDDKADATDGASSAGDARVADVAAALEDAEVVLLALPAGAVDGLLAEHAAALTGKLIIDATNRIGAPVANAAEQIAAAVPDARYARAFNTLGWENFADPVFDGVPADLFFSCAPDDRPLVEELIGAVGLQPAYLGEGKQDVVDGVLPLWFALVQANDGNRRVAFRVLRK